jgi:hypothetical protein
MKRKGQSEGPGFFKRSSEINAFFPGWNIRMAQLTGKSARRLKQFLSSTADRRGERFGANAQIARFLRKVRGTPNAGNPPSHRPLQKWPGLGWAKARKNKPRAQFKKPLNSIPSMLAKIHLDVDKN